MSLNILILGAGAIGSLFGALLSTRHQVTLFCRAPHATAINQHGLIITGHKKNTYILDATDNITTLPSNPDLAIITVKAYDTQSLVQSTQPILKNANHILSLQNGLGNIETITHTMPTKHILAGITTHGAIFTKPGIIKHTGIGRTFIGPITPTSPDILHHISETFTDAGISTTISQDIQKDIWKKAVINSAINPLTTIFHCKNGYLLGNPILEIILDRIITESTSIANTQDFQLSKDDMITQTKKVIHETVDNYSSMFQSIQQNQPTEIDYINGIFKTVGQLHNVPTPLNTLVTNIIHSLSNLS